MGVNRVSLFENIEEVAVAIEPEEAYVLYIHCEKANAENLIARFQEFNEKLLQMNDEVIAGLPEEIKAQITYDDDGNRYTPFELPTNVVAGHCMIMPVSVDFERFPEMKGGFGLQRLSPMELFQWMAVIMRNASAGYGIRTNGKTEQISKEFMEEMNYYRNMCSFYDEFAPPGDSKMYHNMSDFDFTSAISEIAEGIGSEDIATTEDNDGQE